MAFKVLIELFLISLSLSGIASAPESGLIHLGKVDGRNYFANGDIEASWATSRILCNSYGMDHGTVDTRNQVNFLARELFKNYKQGLFWVARYPAPNDTLVEPAIDNVDLMQYYVYPNQEGTGLSRGWSQYGDYEIGTLCQLG